MTKEKLEKEAEEWLDERYLKDMGVRKPCKQAYLAGAEPREKQIQIDAEQIRALQKQNGELTDKVKELEQQIEKMKCCSMCKHYSMSFLPYWCTKNNIAPHCTSKCDKWEIKENDFR